MFDALLWYVSSQTVHFGGVDGGIGLERKYLLNFSTINYPLRNQSILFSVLIPSYSLKGMLPFSTKDAWQGFPVLIRDQRRMSFLTKAENIKTKL